MECGKFRSRLEARWAIFFDTAGIRYEYEPEGFDLDGLWYLPDFWLPDLQTWIEIKPAVPTGEDLQKVLAFSQQIRHQDADRAPPLVYVLVGSPYYDGRTHTYDVMSFVEWTASLSVTGMHWAHCPLCDRVNLSLYGRDRVGCTYCDGVDRNWKETDDAWFHKGDVIIRRPGFILNSPRLGAAYDAARVARFDAPRPSMRHATDVQRRQRAIATFAYRKYGKYALEDYDWDALEEEFDDWLEWKAEHGYLYQ
jgi:hypothetical protein